MEKHYVYIYCDPRKKGEFKYEGVDYTFNYEPFYVGEGKGYRFRRHITNFEIEWNYNTIKNGKIKKIIEEGHDPLKYIIFFKENISKDEAGLIEVDLIKKMGRLNTGDGILANMTEGGEGWKGVTSPFKGKTYEEIHGIEKSEELKNIRRERFLGNDYGKYNKGKKMSEEQKKLLSEVKINKIKQMDGNFNLIKIWNSCKEASIGLNISQSSIYNVLSENYRTKTSGGFKWEYVDKKNNKYKK